MTDFTDELRRLYEAAPSPDQTMLTSAEWRQSAKLRNFLHRHVDDILAMADENKRLRASEDEAHKIISQTPAPHSRPLWQSMCAWLKSYEEARQALAGGDDVGTD